MLLCSKIDLFLYGLIKGKVVMINDIVCLFGVFKKIVLCIINNFLLVCKDMCEKVEVLMCEVGYVFDLLVCGLVFCCFFLIGMVYDNFIVQYIVDMQYGVFDVLCGFSFELVVYLCDLCSFGYIEGVCCFVQQQKLYGVILVLCVLEDQVLVDMFDEIGCCFICIVLLLLDDILQMVVIYDCDGVVEVVDYLLLLGYCDIVLVIGLSVYCLVYECIVGFIDVFVQCGIELLLVCIVEVGYIFELGVVVVEKLLLGKQCLIVIFIGNDEMVVGVYKVVLCVGINILCQFLIIGYDDSLLVLCLWLLLILVCCYICDIGCMVVVMLIQFDGQVVLQIVSVCLYLIVCDFC